MAPIDQERPILLHPGTGNGLRTGKKLRVPMRCIPHPMDDVVLKQPFPGQSWLSRCPAETTGALEPPASSVWLRRRLNGWRAVEIAPGPFSVGVRTS